MSWADIGPRYWKKNQDGWTKQGRSEEEKAAHKAARERYKNNKTIWMLRKFKLGSPSFELSNGIGGSKETKKPRRFIAPNGRDHVSDPDPDVQAVLDILNRKQGTNTSMSTPSESSTCDDSAKQS